MEDPLTWPWTTPLTRPSTDPDIDQPRRCVAAARVLAGSGRGRRPGVRFSITVRSGRRDANPYTQRKDTATMSGTTDDLKGRAKEAVGNLTDDDQLEREGKVDRAAGTIKDKVEDAKEWAEDKVDQVRDRVRND